MLNSVVFKFLFGGLKHKASLFREFAKFSFKFLFGGLKLKGDKEEVVALCSLNSSLVD